MPQVSDYARFGGFELDLRAGELRRNGIRLRLPEQPLQILTMLLEHPGEVVTRDELKQRLWSNDTFVDFEHGLNAAVKRLRIALGESGTHPQYIETLPRHGYRLLVPVKQTRSQDQRPSEQRVGEAGTPTAASIVSRWKWVSAAALAFLMISAVAFLLWQSLRRQRGPVRVVVAVLPLQNLSGDHSRDFVVDGLTEELINQIGRLDPQRIGIVGSTAVMPYKIAAKKISDIGHDLGADYILEGSVREEGRTVRITVQLIAVASQTHIWAESYESDSASPLRIQSEIAHAVAQHIGKVDFRR